MSCIKKSILLIEIQHGITSKTTLCMFLADFRCQTNNKEKESERTIDSTFGMSSILTNMIASISHSTLLFKLCYVHLVFSFFILMTYAHTIQAGYRWLLKIYRASGFFVGFFLYLDSIYFHSVSILCENRTLPDFSFFPFFDYSNGICISQRTWNICRMNGGNSNWRLADKLPRNCWSRHWKDLVT